MVFAIHWHESAMDLHVFPIPIPPPASHPSGSSQCTRPEHLSHASNLGWRSVSHLIIYRFQCYSLRTSHPHLFPQSPKVCSIHLCLFFCFAYRVNVTIFLEHSLVLFFLGIGMRFDLSQSCSHCWVFQICWHIEWNTLMASSFRVLNSYTGISSHLLALLAACFPKPTWLQTPECLAPGYWPHYCSNLVH